MNKIVGWLVWVPVYEEKKEKKKKRLLNESDMYQTS